MIAFANNVLLVQSVTELPDLKGAETVYLDVETSSMAPDKSSLNPWFDCQPAGLCITVGEHPYAYYIPIAHHADGQLCPDNLDWITVRQWLHDILIVAKRWVNHNVKYDFHALNNTLLKIPFHLEFVDTVVLSKIIDSDRGYGRGDYTLGSLSKDWLAEDISKYEDRINQYLGPKNKDYGSIPIDILGEYGGQDVLTNRRLWKYIQARVPDQCRQVMNTEIELTKVLIDMELVGLHVDENELMLKQYELLRFITDQSEIIHKKVGDPIRAWANEDCFDLLCNAYGLPVLSYDEKTNQPTFNADALKMYIGYPSAPDEVVKMMLEVRKANTLNNLFVKKFLELNVDGVLHCDFNQSVRTGRMSCKRPNQQQNSKASKKLIHPAPGCEFISMDYSQVEFRLIVDYIADPAALRAYQEDPDTDFHMWVSEMCGIPRKPAKNINFAVGYGSGQKKVLKMLCSNMELMGSLKELAGDDLEYFKKLCEQRAREVFEGYHDTLPSLRRTSRRAEAACKHKGYVFNKAGRRRHMPSNQAWRAFNALCQSTAADLMKNRLVALWKFCKPRGIDVVCSVHDESLKQAPIGTGDELKSELIAVAEDMSDFELKVPIRTDFNVSEVSWGHCDS